MTYSLEGRDAPSFDINETNGQLRTKSGIPLIADETYTVIVAADDGRDIARITVSIEATAAPPNNPPVFSAGRPARSRACKCAGGHGHRVSVTATDADGDTVTFSLEGTSAASFRIAPTSGQISTKAGVTLTAGTTYNVTVVASDTKGGRATAAVTITVSDNSPPAFLESFASRSVAEGQPASAAVGGPVSATDPDGDTLDYTLGGADAASFTIGRSSGQISTAVVLDYETKPYMW